MIEYMKKHDEEYEEPADFNKNKVQSSDGFAFNPAPSGGVVGGVGMGEQNPDIKAHHLLVLLLRLRQICNHPGLIKTMIDTEARVNDGLETSTNKEDDDLIAQMSGMALGKKATRDDEDSKQDLEEEMAK